MKILNISFQEWETNRQLSRCSRTRVLYIMLHLDRYLIKQRLTGGGVRDGLRGGLERLARR